ncbi:MAG: metal-dependent phosphohydrolase [Proteobacteria bacterium]|nr:metal-dependent phosphohydrolase [Pseudomonadota bacterium]
MVFVTLMLVVSAIIATVQYIDSSRERVAAAEQSFAAAEIAISAHLSDIFRPAEMATEVVGQNPVMLAPTTQTRLAFRELLARFLGANPAFASVFVGYGDGDFVLMRPLRGAEERERFEAPDQAAFLVQAIERPEPAVFIFYDAGLEELSRRTADDFTSYDPRTRPWYQQAMASADWVRTMPYVFFTTGEVGTTIAHRGRGDAVAGVDVTLASLGQAMARLRPVRGAEIALVDANGLLIAHADLDRVAVPNPDDDGRLLLTDMNAPANAVLTAALSADRLDSGHLDSFAMADGTPYRSLVVPIDSGGDEDYNLVLAVREGDLFAAARAAARQSIVILAAIMAVAVVITIVVARHISRPLVRLAEDVGAIRRFDFSSTPMPRFRILEIDQLAQAVAGMKEVIRRFLDISTTIAAEPDLDRLLELLLDEIIETTRTGSGVLYLASEDGTGLVPYGARLAGARAAPLPAGPVALSRGDVLLVRAIADENALGGPASPAELEALGLAEHCAAMDVVPRHLLATPLFNRSHDLIGVLLLCTAQAPDESLVRFTEKLSGSAAIAVETRQLIAAQRQLFESLLQLIAQAIDAKSPYTGGHCARVPELTKLLAGAADRATEGPYAEFRLNADDWEAIHVAAWLHDCGKVTTPEYVVDKATKLETIHDRIHEIRMRFEVLKREAVIAHLRTVIAEGYDSPERDAALQARLAQIDDDFAFVAACNIGGEAMSDENIVRLNDLARQTWTRTLDDRLGISHPEAQRLADTPTAALPVAEPLLADKPEHVIARPEAEKLAPDNPWGFRVDVHEALYNRGELYNLSIRRGTLTAEDRYKINEHMIQTIKMLDSLPFPHYLRSVPELAGGHHEKMDGTGYPKRLTAEQMSPVARMMAIADIFEALTAADRPYKKAKTLSEALRIMGFMVKDRHIDAELFDLFLTSGVWRAYADRFLAPEQIDAVDIETFRPPQAAA